MATSLEPISLSSRGLGERICSGADIRAFGLLFILSGVIDLIWILSYPDYALTVFGRRVFGWAG